jgi:hypothetical protein
MNGTLPAPLAVGNVPTAGAAGDNTEEEDGTLSITSSSLSSTMILRLLIRISNWNAGNNDICSPVYTRYISFMHDEHLHTCDNTRMRTGSDRAPLNSRSPPSQQFRCVDAATLQR